MHTNMIIRQTLRLGTTVQRMNPKRNATVFKRVYPPKRLPGKIFSIFLFFKHHRGFPHIISTNAYSGFIFVYVSLSADFLKLS